MRQALNLHPDSPSAAVASVAVEIGRPQPYALLLRYIVTGRIGELRLPPVAAPARTDELWRHTCFEAFLRPLAAAAYYEFNFSPSSQWAAYRFSGYRDGMAPLNEMTAPRIEVHASGEGLEMTVALALDGLPGDAPWRLGLSAVIEETSGAKSYWALAHPPGKPDFHHADCFALELPPA